MPTEADYHLEPQSGPLSKVICERCGQEIGEVYTASQTPTGVKAGPSDEELELNIRDLVSDHLDKFHHGEPDTAATYEDQSTHHQPVRAPMEKGGRGGEG